MMNVLFLKYNEKMYYIVMSLDRYNVPKYKILVINIYDNEYV